MSSDTNTSLSARTDSDLGLSSNHSLGKSEDAYNAPKTPSSKRKPRPSSSAKKKLRSSEIELSRRLWTKGLPVWVYVWVSDDEQQWKEGVVANVLDDIADGGYKIVVHIIDENGEEVIPSTIKKRNRDPIPSADPSDPTYKLTKYIRARDERLEGLSGVDQQHMRCLIYHSNEGIGGSKEATTESPELESESPELDGLGKALLDDDPESSTALKNLVHSLMVDKRVIEVVRSATNTDVCLPQHALAYFVGQLCGIELSESVTKDVDPHHVLDRIGKDDNVECTMSQIFLVSAMTARTSKRKKMHPATPLYDSRGRAVLSDPEKLKARMNRLKTALAAIHASQTDQPSVSGPAFALLSHGIRMLIDMRGTSDPVLDKLAAEGVCRNSRVLRFWVQKLADAINPLHTRAPAPSGMSHVTCFVADNADYHQFHRVRSCVPVGDVLLGVESEDDTAYFNANYMEGLGSLEDLDAKDLAATEDDDRIAQDVIDYQNLLAMYIAYLEFDRISDEPESSRSRCATRPAIGSTVSFAYRSEEWSGTVKSTSASDAVIEFLDGNNLTTKLIPLGNISARMNDATSGAQDDNGGEHQEDDVQHEPRMFEGDRHRFDPTTTTIISVLTGLSSKNNETARQVIQEVISLYGEDAFHQAVHLIVADQEFMPTMVAEFFAKLRQDDELPILPMLAIGHAMKGMSVSIMSYYKCLFNPMLEALGVKVGSPEYLRYYKGSVIRDTNALVTDFTEMLAVAAARQYLSEVGKSSRIKQGGQQVSPIDILNDHFSSTDSSSDRYVTVMESTTRPLSITVTDSLMRLARDFQIWAREKWGTSKRPDVGPSGFERPSPEAEPQVADQQQIDGLLTLCKNAGILNKSSRKDKPTLAKKLFLHEVRRDKEAAIKFGPSRKLPAGTNSTGLALYDLLFGFERFAIVMGHRLTRVRPKDDEEVGSYAADLLVFFKSLTASTFSRWQPNYQRLSLSFLIMLQLIIKHDKPRCRDLALKRIRLAFSVSEWGDSHKCYPVDLLQEHSMVEQVKKVGSRDPGAPDNLEKRARLHAYMRMRKIEARAQNNGRFPSIQPERASRVEDERRQADTILAFWVRFIQDLSLTDDVDCDRIPGLGDDKTEVKFADRSRAYWRPIDAIDHILVAGSAFIRGFGIGCEVALPHRDIPILRELHRFGSKKSSSTQSDLSAYAKKMKIDAEQRLRDDGHVIVPSSASMLDGLKNAGANKSAIYQAVLSTMSDNVKYLPRVGQIGDGPSKPVILSRSKQDAANHLWKRAEREGGVHAPIHTIVDVAKDLRSHIPRRPGGKGNTVIDLARDFICQMLKTYLSIGVELICLTMDVAEFMTSLRVIPHAKRGKMDAIKTPHGSLAKVKKGTDDLTPYGARSDLLVCGDKQFTELLFNTICNEARAIAHGKWAPPTNGRKFALAVVGGSPQACVVVGIGTDIIRLNADSIIVSCQELENEMEASKLVCQEEGEMMVWGAFRSIIRMGFTHEFAHDGVDCVTVVHSDDSDAFAGIGMQAVFHLESTCVLRNKRFLGAVYLRGPSKSISQITRLGKIFKTNLEIDLELCPTGRGFQFMIDLLSVYETLEQDDSLPKMPRGHRAMSVLGVSYTIVNHDYLRMASYGLTYSRVISALKSKTYKAEFSKYNSEEVSPINLTQRAVFMDKNHFCHTGLNLHGILLLLHHAFINRPATKKLLLKKYTVEELSDGLGYHIVRAAAILAGEIHPVPDPISLMAYLSCANLIFRRWSCHLYDRNGRTDNELNATRYVEKDPGAKGAHGRAVMTIDFTLCDLLGGVGGYRPSWDRSTLLTKLRTSCYGALFSGPQLESDSCVPFDPVEEARTALHYEGYYPSKKIPSDVLPAMPEQTSTSSTEGGDDGVEVDVDDGHNTLLDEEIVDSESDGGSDDERSVAGSMSIASAFALQ